MTEAEWLACEDPFRLIYGPPTHPNGCYAPDMKPLVNFSERRYRLLACALARHTLYKSAILSRKVEVTERFADGLATRGDLLAGRSPTRPSFNDAERIAWDVTWDPQQVASSDPEQEGPLSRQFIDVVLSIPVWNLKPVVFLRDIFGNPFRRVAFDPAWRTSTVLDLARGMYDTRDFGPMPILADALQDAGCDHPDILAHCRDPKGTHVRGCWVVDLVLGKT